MTLHRMLPTKLVAQLFWAGLSFEQVAVCIEALYPHLGTPTVLDCENAFRRYVLRRRRERRS